jgi:hypothetical protein
MSRCYFISVPASYHEIDRLLSSMNEAAMGAGGSGLELSLWILSGRGTCIKSQLLSVLRPLSVFPQFLELSIDVPNIPEGESSSNPARCNRSTSGFSILYKMHGCLHHLSKQPISVK